MSERMVSHTATMLALLAHEMVHLRDRLQYGLNGVHHGSRFKRVIGQVSRVHGFDPHWFS